MPLRGRRAELSVLAGLAAAVRAGQSRVLVLRGEPGVGKTALLDELAGQAAGCRVVRAVGMQSEIELAFAGLHQLLAPMLDRLEQLPVPQREALRTAFGLSAGPAPDRFLVALAVLSLLSEVAGERPLVCVIDDQQWLDLASAQALGFAARRLGADPVGLVFAARVPGDELAGLPELAVGGLAEGDARALLDSALTGPLDARVRDQIVAEAGGNPLALLELPRGMTSAELAGGFGLPGAGPGAMGAMGSMGSMGAASVTGRIEDSFRRRLDALPAPTRRLLLLAAADPSGDSSLVWRAAGRLGLPVAELERSAGRAQARGGMAAAAAFLEWSVRLTADPAHLVERTLGAAQASARAGAFDQALGLLVMTEAWPLDELASARVDLLRGQVALASGMVSDASPLLLKAARRLEPLDPGLARETYLDAWTAAFSVGQLAAGDLAEVCRAARALPRSPQPGPVELLLDGLALMITDGLAAAAPALRQAVSLFAGDGVSAGDRLRWSYLALWPAIRLWDDEGYRSILARHLQLVRDAGALDRLPIDLRSAGVLAAWSGDFGAAAALIAEVEAVREATGARIPAYATLLLVGLRGNPAEAVPLIDATIKAAGTGRPGAAVTTARWATAILYNGLGRYEEAREEARQAAGDPSGFQVSLWALPELIEAAVRSGNIPMAVDAVARLAETTQPSGTDLALGIEARSRALVAESQAADGLYAEAIDRLGRTQLRTELARAHLLYGEWLRRENRRTDAREQLHTAHDLLSAIGMEAFAERARRELLATGETARKRTTRPAVAASQELTAQEAQVARLARDGLSNPEIGARLFISSHTVQYHLSKVYPKLGITSRGQLHQVLPAALAASTPG